MTRHLAPVLLATTSASHSLPDASLYNPPPTPRPPPPRKHPWGLNDGFYHCSGPISIFLEFIFIDLDIFIDIDIFTDIDIFINIDILYSLKCN